MRGRGRAAHLSSRETGERCYERNDTDLVGVTCPWAGAQRSRVNQEQYPRTASQIALLASGAHRVGVRETPGSDLRMTVARETMAI
ncbi:hypothetical protein T01_4772 [Trichinella spiralis]|uniref:Uncharacterized protein n=1 Tax=Trichinella spiralis TaxID=6334 RepID=A0A0V1C0P0_TRISP|nr:hypothetical protein T01_4772 [Trichinella spiralis]